MQTAGLRAVLFDMDGLIVDTEPIHFAAFKEIMRHYGVDLPESVMPEFIGYTEQDNLRDLKAKYEIAEPLDALVEARRVIYLELVRTLPIEVFPGFWELSAAVRERGMKQAVVSSAARVQVEIVLGRLFAEQGQAGSGSAGFSLQNGQAEACPYPMSQSPLAYFDAIVSGDDVTQNKPAPDIYLEGARKLSLPPTDCLALEDSPPGVQSATAAGMTVIAVPNKYTRELTFPGALAVVPSLDAVREYLGW